MIKNNLILIYLIIMLIGFLGCQRKSHEMNPGIKVHFNKLNITWNGKIRLSGGIPVLENTNLKYHEVHTVEVDTVFLFQFLHNFEDHVEVKVVISPVNNSMVFYLSPNNFHSQKASDFVGVLFENFPEMKEAAVKEQGMTLKAKSMDELLSLKSEQILIEYEDGKYGALQILNGKGYNTQIASFNKSIGFQAYHSKDGHNESNIPIAVIAFGDSLPKLKEYLNKNRVAVDAPEIKN